MNDESSLSCIVFGHFSLLSFTLSLSVCVCVCFGDPLGNCCFFTLHSAWPLNGTIVEQVQPAVIEGRPSVIQREGEIERREHEPVVREIIRPRTGWWTERKRGMQP